MWYYLGIPIAPEKTLGPPQILSFAGIELDFCLMEARLPVDKVQKCIEIITDFLKRKKVTLREVQSLTGLLNFACSVIVPGRAFLRRLIDLTIGVRSPNSSIRLTRSVKEDLEVWLSFLSQYNCKSFFLPDVWNNSDKLSFYTDAAVLVQFLVTIGVMVNGRLIGLAKISQLWNSTLLFKSPPLGRSTEQTMCPIFH